MRAEGSAGDADYGVIGPRYSLHRQADERIAAMINQGLGDAEHVLNVGAGTGSYEPSERRVVAVEPSATMRAMRPTHLSTAIDAVAEALPFEDKSFDASMATFTVHQWPQVAAGLREMRRVTRGPIVVLTCDPSEVQKFWLNDYAPAVLAIEARRYPNIDSIAAALGGTNAIDSIAIPWDCKDGFNEAYYGRPERLLEQQARLACSAWSLVDRSLAQSYVHDLQRDLHCLGWDERYGHYRKQPLYYGSLRLIVSRP
jgi:SAM-dependent methyltransferase